jgi:hypothetical protein
MSIGMYTFSGFRTRDYFGNYKVFEGMKQKHFLEAYQESVSTGAIKEIAFSFSHVETEKDHFIIQRFCERSGKYVFVNLARNSASMNETLRSMVIGLFRLFEWRGVLIYFYADDTAKFFDGAEHNVSKTCEIMRENSHRQNERYCMIHYD